jgi:hypothetical protein
VRLPLPLPAKGWKSETRNHAAKPTIASVISAIVRRTQILRGVGRRGCAPVPRACR